MSGFAAALARGLEVEYAAVYAYGAAGPFVGDPLADAVLDGYDAHRRARDRIAAALHRLGVAVPAAPAAYDLRPRPRGPADALTLLAAIEDDTCAGCAGIVAASAPPSLRLAVLRDWQSAAVRAARWRTAGGISPASRPLPGLVRPGQSG